MSQVKEEDVRLLENNIRSQISMFQFWTGENPHPNFMVNILETILKSPVFRVQVKEEEDSGEEGLIEGSDDEFIVPSRLSSSSSSSSSASSLQSWNAKSKKRKVTPSKRKITLQKQQQQREVSNFSSSSNPHEQNSNPSTLALALNSNECDELGQYLDGHDSSEPPPAIDSIEVSRVSSIKSERKGEVRMFNGYGYLFNKLNQSGSTSWICRRRCGGWALEKDGVFKATKGHSADCLSGLGGRTKSTTSNKKNKKKETKPASNETENNELPLLQSHLL